MGVITVNTRDRKPIYEQLTDNIRRLVLQGILRPNEQLPSVRTLAVELAINPNTIQKAYAELERQGIICSMQGRGSFVADNVSELSRAQLEQTADTLKASMKAAKDAGMTREEALALLAGVWEA